MSANLGTPYKRAGELGEFDSIVIGSGIGGLATASLLARHAGQRVLVLERHYTAGGYTHVFRRPGFEWDVGVHYIGDVREGSILKTVFDAVGDGSLEWADMGPVYDKIILGDRVYPFPKGAANLRAFLKERFPDEGDAIDAYFGAMREALSHSMTFHTEKALPEPVAKLAGWWMRRKFLKWSDRTTREVLESFTRNQELIAVLTGQYGDYGLPPAESSFVIHCMVANHYLEGGWYPVGGASRIAASILPVIEEGGGRVLTNAEVAEVVVEGGRAVGVRLAADDRVLRAPRVISDAGVFNTFGRLLAPEVRERHGLDQLLTKVHPSFAHLCLYVGLEGSADELGLEPPNLWIYPNERHEENMAAFLKDPDAPFPVVYVSFPAAKDPDFQRRFPGHSTIDVITVASYDWFERWGDTRWKKRGADYEAFKQHLSERLLAALEAHVPSVRGRVKTWELSTPLTTEHFAGYARGELYGLDHGPSRFRQRWLRPATPVPGLYLTGQDVLTAGVAGALFGGVVTASALTRRNLIGEILKQRKRQHEAAAAAE